MWFWRAYAYRRSEVVVGIAAKLAQLASYRHAQIRTPQRCVIPNSVLLPNLACAHLYWLGFSSILSAGMQGLVGDEEFTWRVLRGSGGDVAITCLASAGPRKVAVGGSGGKLEVWDVEAVCAGAGGGGGEASAGLVHRLVSSRFMEA